MGECDIAQEHGDDGRVKPSAGRQEHPSARPRPALRALGCANTAHALEAQGSEASESALPARGAPIPLGQVASLPQSHRGETGATPDASVATEEYEGSGSPPSPTSSKGVDEVEAVSDEAGWVLTEAPGLLDLYFISGAELLPGESFPKWSADPAQVDGNLRMGSTATGPCPLSSAVAKDSARIVSSIPDWDGGV